MNEWMNPKFNHFNQNIESHKYCIGSRPMFFVFADATPHFLQSRCTRANSHAIYMRKVVANRGMGFQCNWNTIESLQRPKCFESNSWARSWDQYIAVSWVQRVQVNSFQLSTARIHKTHEAYIGLGRPDWLRHKCLRHTSTGRHTDRRAQKDGRITSRTSSLSRR